MKCSGPTFVVVRAPQPSAYLFPIVGNVSSAMPDCITHDSASTRQQNEIISQEVNSCKFNADS